MTTNNAALKFMSAISVGVHTLCSSNGPVKINGDLPAFLEKHPDTTLMPNGPQGISYVFEFVDFKDADHWDHYELYPTAITHNESQTLAFWAFDAPVPVDNPALIRLMKWFRMSLDQAIPLPGHDGWKLHYVRSGRTYRPDQMVEVYLPENRRFTSRKLSRKGRF